MKVDDAACLIFGDFRESHGGLALQLGAADADQAGRGAADLADGGLPQVGCQGVEQGVAGVVVGGRVDRGADLGVVLAVPAEAAGAVAAWLAAAQLAGLVGAAMDRAE